MIVIEHLQPPSTRFVCKTNYYWLDVGGRGVFTSQGAKSRQVFSNFKHKTQDLFVILII